MGFFAPLDIFIYTFQEYSKESSICGICNAGLAKNGWRKFCWMIFFLAGLGGTIYACTQLVQSFLSYPISTAISLEKLTQINFPGVTVCNQNRIDCSRLSAVITMCESQPTLTNCTQMNNSTMTVLNRIKTTACPDPTPQDPQGGGTTPLPGGSSVAGGAGATSAGGAGATSAGGAGATSAGGAGATSAGGAGATSAAGTTVQGNSPTTPSAAATTTISSNSGVTTKTIAGPTTTPTPNTASSESGATSTTLLATTTTTASTNAGSTTIKSSSGGTAASTTVASTPTTTGGSTIGSSTLVTSSTGSSTSTTASTLVGSTSAATGSTTTIASGTSSTASSTATTITTTTATTTVTTTATTTTTTIATTTTTTTATTTATTTTATTTTTADTATTTTTTTPTATTPTATTSSTTVTTTTTKSSSSTAAATGSTTTASASGSTAATTTHILGRKKRSPIGGGNVGIVGGNSRGGGGSGSSGNGGMLTLSQLGTTPDAVNTEYEFLMDYMGLSEIVRQMIGHTFADLIQSCTFRQRDCLEEDNFFLTSSPNFGNCYTFNSANNTNDILGGQRVTSMSGPAFGLQLVLNLDQADYMKTGQTKQAGARLVVQDPANRPITDEYGYDVQPNTLTNVAIQQQTLVRLEAPFSSNCSSAWSQTNYTDYVPNVPGWDYTLALCNRICLQTSFISDCNCFHPLYLDSDMTRQGKLPCNLTSSTNETACINGVIEEFDNGYRKCSCNVNCFENGYELAMSSSTWPSVQYLTTAEALYGYANVSAGDPSIQENLLQVQVYFMTLNVQNITESPVYSWSDGSYISAFGGSLGLFLGIAIVSIFEILEFFMDYFINLWIYVVHGKRPDKENNNNRNGTVKSIVPYSPGFDYKTPKI